MGESKRRRQAMGEAYGMPIAERAAQYVRQVPVRKKVGTALVTAKDGNNCVDQAAFAITMGRRQWEADPDFALRFCGCDPRDLVAQVGQLLAYDVRNHCWDSWFEQGHCWVINTGSDTLIELNSESWGPGLRRVGFQLADGALDAPVVGIGTPELLPLLDRLDGVQTINDCFLVYVPGVHAIELARAIRGQHPQHLRNLAAAAEQFPNWRRWCAQTAENGHCTADVLVSAAELLADLGVGSAA